MGLSVPLFIVGPLALLTGSLLASLSAGWIANLASGGTSAHTRSRLWATFAVSLAASLVGALVASGGAFLIYRFGRDIGLIAGLLIYYLPATSIFIGATSVAVWRLRTPTVGRLGFAGGAALSLATAWMVSLMLMGNMFLGGLGDRIFAYLFIPGTETSIILRGSLVLTVIGVFLTVRSSRRFGRRSLQRDASLSLLALGSAPALLFGAISLGCSVSYCMP